MGTFRDQESVIFYEVLKPSETITADRYRKQMFKLDRAVKDKRPQYDRRHDNVTLQHDNFMAHVAKTVQETLQVINWEILSHPPYSPDIGPCDNHLFPSMYSALLGERFSSCEEVTKRVYQWIATKEPNFFIVNHLLPENVKILYFSMKSILNEIYFILLFQFLLYFL